MHLNLKIAWGQRSLHIRKMQIREIIFISIQVVLIEIDALFCQLSQSITTNCSSHCSFFKQVYMELFCKFISWTRCANPWKIMDNCWTIICRCNGLNEKILISEILTCTNILMYKVISLEKSWGQIMVTLWPKITEMPSNSNPKLRSSSCSYAKRSSINSHDMHRMSLGLLRMHWSVIMRSRDYFWASLLVLALANNFPCYF